MKTLTTGILATCFLLGTARLTLGGAAIVRTVDFDFSVSALAPSIASFPVPLANNSGQATFVLTSDGSGSGINITMTSMDNVVGTFYNLFDTTTTLPQASIPATYLDFQGGAFSPDLGTTFSHAGYVPPANTPGSITLPHPYAGGGAPASTGTLNATTGGLSLFVESRTDISPLLGYPAGTAVLGTQPLTSMPFDLSGAPGGGTSGMDGTYSLQLAQVPYPELLAANGQGIDFPDHSVQLVNVYDSTGVISGIGDVTSYGTDGTVMISGSNFNVNNLLHWVPGDANLDGTVNLSDVATISAHWMNSGTFGVDIFTEDGDVNMDGVVNLSDVATISTNWMVDAEMGLAFEDAMTAAGFNWTTMTFVPEPSSLAMLAGGGVLVAIGGLRARRRKKRRNLRRSMPRPDKTGRSY
jgi:Dockerin type I domain/PEP-CTERM motif